MQIITKNAYLVTLQRIIDDKDGILTIAESGKQIPFKIKRVYFITDTFYKSSERGHHAHKDLEQVIFCINGSFKLLLNDGNNEQEVILDKPDQGIFLGKELWHTMSDFSDNCIILVMSSDLFNENDYIRDFEEFKKYLKTIN